MTEDGGVDVEVPRAAIGEPTTAPSAQSATADDILIRTDHCLGELVLNRPAVLNTLTPEMVAAIPPALKNWHANPTVYAIAISAVSNRAFCAGGDIRRMLRDVTEDPATAFARSGDEYAMNAALRSFTKPSAALIDGLCVGSGVGLTINATHRLAGPNYRFAMPEVSIGFFPDVGATWFLSALPGEIGTYLALSGRTIERADAYALGLVTHCVAPEAFAAIRAGLADADPIDPLIYAHHVDPGPSGLAERRAVIDRVFAYPTVSEILSALGGVRGDAASWCEELRDELGAKCPTSLAVALRQMRAPERTNLRDALQLEYRLARAMLVRPDFAEGVRAMLIDKDGAPQWSPSDLGGVDQGELACWFAQVDARDELVLPDPPKTPTLSTR